MQLWKKNYLAAYILFLVILNLSMLLLAAMGFKNDLETRMNDVIKRQQQFAYTVEGLMSSSVKSETLSAVRKADVMWYRLRPEKDFPVIQR